MSSLPPPPPPPAAPRRPRRWPWLAAVAVLALALIASLTALVVVRQDRDDLAAQVADLEKQSGGDQQARAPTTDGGTSDSPRTTADGSTPNNPEVSPENPQQGPSDSSGSDNPLGGLQDLFGSAGDLLGGVDPRCLLDGGFPNLTGGGVDGTLEQQVAKLADLVAEDRGLEFKTPVKPDFLPADEFDKRVADEVGSSYDDKTADLDARVLTLLGAIPEGTDLKQLQQDLMAGQVAGFYDPKTGEIVVRVPDGTDKLSVTDQITLAHELDHALTDQALGLPDTETEGSTDANLARLALVEGDATLLMQRIALTKMGLLDQLGSAFSPDMAASQAELESTPAYLRNQLLFPYLSGLAYTCRLHADGGWPAVDDAYKSLPSTTAEILFAGRGGRPEDAPDPKVPSGWDEARRDTLGAAQLQWLFEAPGTDEKAAIDSVEQAVKSWAGGELVLATKGDQSALGVSLVDRGGDQVLCNATKAWYEAAFDPQTASDGSATVYRHDDRVAVLQCGADTVELGIAPTLEDARVLAGA